jgi:hypothetical protein
MKSPFRTSPICGVPAFPLCKGGGRSVCSLLPAAFFLSTFLLVNLSTSLHSRMVPKNSHSALVQIAIYNSLPPKELQTTHYKLHTTNYKLPILLNNNEQISISSYSYLRQLDKNGIFPIVEPLLVTDLMENGSVSY